MIHRVDIEEALAQVVLKGDFRLPPYPATAMKLSKILERADYGLGDLVAAMRNDQAYVANIVRLANSAHYSRGTPVTTLEAAVSRVGAQELHRLALASGLSSWAGVSGALAVMRRTVWRDSLMTAMICEALVAGQGATSEAFVAGMLQSVGKLVALSAMEGVLPKTVAPKPAPYWWAIVERFSRQLGLALAAQWSLPERLRAVMAEEDENDELLADVRRAQLISAMLQERSFVSSRELEETTELPSSRARKLAERLTHLPEFLRAFEGPAPSAPEAKLVPSTAPPTFDAPLDLPIELVGSDAPVAGQVLGFDQALLCVRAPSAIHEQALLEARIAWTKPLSLFVTVKSCESEAPNQFRLALFPFAMKEGLVDDWRALMTQR